MADVANDAEAADDGLALNIGGRFLGSATYIDQLWNRRLWKLNNSSGRGALTSVLFESAAGTRAYAFKLFHEIYHPHYASGGMAQRQRV